MMERVLKKKKATLLQSVESLIKEYGLFDPAARILIGVSGGPDSMALLSLLSDLSPQWNLKLRVLYCHHGLRAAADEEEAFVRTWSKKLGCAFAARKLPVRDFQKQTGMSLQEAARELRYQTFWEYIKHQKVEKVALAHTANDQAEEFLIGLIRGAGLGGLAGIPVKRGPVIRPLIKTYRPEILNYLASKHIPYKEDVSNRDFRYLRARVRHHLLPELRKYSPNIVAQLNQMIGLLQKDEEYLQEKADQLADDSLSFSDHTASIRRSDLINLPQAVGSRLIQKAIFKSLGHLRHIRAVHILSILEAAQGNRLGGRIILPGSWSAQWDRDNIKILPAFSDPQTMMPFAYEIDRPQEVFIRETSERVSFRKVKTLIGSALFTGDKNLARVDFDKLTWPLLIRNMRPGDRFRPLGLEGSKKVSRFFIDRKVPQVLRSRIPLVLSGGAIVWIAGMEIGQPFCLDLHSTRALELEYRK